jgi:Xaa-Pro aminopeptidase
MLLGLMAVSATAQPLVTDVLPPEEFAARRAALMARIGDGVAVLSGATETPNYVKFRQNNHVFYLSGIEVPRAVLVVDGGTKTTTLYLPPRNEPLERSEGPVLVPGEEAQRLTGIEQVLPRERFAEAVTRLGAEARVVYLPHRAESLGAGTPGQATLHANASAGDPWDGRPSKDAAFLQRVTAQAAGATVKDLDPILDEMRRLKSPREIALVREATRIAGLGLMEGMRAAAPGMYEYEVAAVADYVFGRHGARGFGYFPLVAAGSNAHYPHYHGGSSRLGADDLVLFDYAPDYRYYTSDVTRMFPASGRFSPAQREIYTVYLRLYQALMTSIAPRMTPRAIMDEAVKKMDAFLASVEIGDPKVKEAAGRFVERYRTSSSRSLGHYVGMEVHDVGLPPETLQPGMIFTIEPALTIPEDRVYVRLEDVILVTETGYENLSAFVPVEVEDIERLMAEPGLGPTPTMSPSAQTTGAR